MPDARQKLAQKAPPVAVILAVAHERFRDLYFSRFTTDNVIVFDIKGFIDRDKVDGRL